jgi:Protein of unknown function, DUF481
MAGSIMRRLGDTIPRPGLIHCKRKSIRSLPMSRWISLVVFLSALPLLAQADTVELTNGDLLHGTITEQTERSVVIEHPVLGRVELPIEQVNAVVVIPDGPGAQAEGQDEQARDKTTQASPTLDPAVAALDTDLTLADKLLPGWDKHFELGINGSDGNSQTFNLVSGFNATKEDENNRWTINATYFRNQDDGNRTRNEFIGIVNRDWLMPGSPWFKFANGRFDYDEFQDWESRASGFLGVGKVLRETPKHVITGRVGLGGSYEFGTVNELVPEAMLGLEWAYTINDRQTLKSYATVFPDLNEFGESRTLAGAEWVIQIDEADGVSLKFGLLNEYESKTEGIAKHNDVKYYGALVFDF